MSEATTSTTTPGKVCIVTGSNEGIGKATAVEMAKQPGIKVIMACRNPDKCRAAVDEVKSASGNQDVVPMTLDLSSQESIKRFVEEFKQLNISLNYLINNAGIFNTPYGKTVDGYESQFGVNHLGTFLLTNLLLDKLEASENPRVVVVASHLHHKSPKLDFNNLSVSEKEYNGEREYNRSKLCNVLFVKELQRKLDARGSRIVVNNLHPGVVNTNLFKNYNGLIRKVIIPLFFASSTPEKSGKASASLALGTEPQYQGVKGSYFDLTVQKETSEYSNNQEAATNLWNKSVEYCHL